MKAPELIRVCSLDEVPAGEARGYTVERYRRILHRIRERMPDAAISADVIVAFPGETDAEAVEPAAVEAHVADFGGYLSNDSGQSVGTERLDRVESLQRLGEDLEAVHQPVRVSGARKRNERQFAKPPGDGDRHHEVVRRNAAYESRGHRAVLLR